MRCGRCCRADERTCTDVSASCASAAYGVCGAMAPSRTAWLACLGSLTVRRSDPPRSACQGPSRQRVERGHATPGDRWGVACGPAAEQLVVHREIVPDGPVLGDLALG